MRKLEIISGRSRATVSAYAPGHTFVASGAGITGVVELEDDRVVKMSARFALAALDANDRLKNWELKKFLDLDRGPVAEASLVEPFDIHQSGDRLTGKARIELVVDHRRMRADLSVEGSYAQATGKFALTFTGLSYQPPKLLLLKVKDRLDIDVSVALSESA